MPLSSRLRHCSPPSPPFSFRVSPPKQLGLYQLKDTPDRAGSPTQLTYLPRSNAALQVHLCNNAEQPHVTSNVSASAQVRTTPPVTPMLSLPPLSRGVQGMKVDDIETRFRSAVSTPCPHVGLRRARPLMVLWVYAVPLLVFSPPPSSSASTTTAGTRARRLRRLCWRTGRQSRRPVVLCTQHTPQQLQCVSVARAVP
jgi:hypothetical protein